MSQTEQDIARSLMRGHTIREIAERRRTSVNTVNNQIQALYIRFGVGSRAAFIVELFRRARRPVAEGE